jgi:SAM-dependent methyltransferase
MATHSHPPQAQQPQASARRADSWTRYWASGALHSCAGSFAGNYAGAVLEFWRGVFARAPATPRMLELCCGNAPLAKLALEQVDLPSADADIDAVDLAAVNPAWLAELPSSRRQQVRVHSQVDVARLPFPVASYDLCLSQYGLEYAPPEALLEVRRVCRAGGWFAAVMHHQDSLPVRIGREENAHADWLLAADGPLQAGRAVLEPLARARTAEGQRSLQGDAAAADLRAKFNQAMAQLQARIDAAPTPDLLLEQRDQLMQCLQLAGRRGLPQAMQQWQAQREALLDARLRQRELVDCARDREQLLAWIAPLQARHMELAELHFDNGALAGWAVQLQLG